MFKSDNISVTTLDKGLTEHYEETMINLDLERFF